MAKSGRHRGDILMLNVEIECGEPEPNGWRRVGLIIGGIEVFGDYVYDTAPSGKRTVEWARLSLLKLFAARLKKVLEDE